MPPTMPAWNLALRFALELAALVGLGFGAWKLAPGLSRWPAVVAAPLIASAIWGVFNVIDDPSRSGSAPIEVAGWIRLTIELVILGGGALALILAGRRDLGIVLAALTAIHYITSWSRIDWLLQA